MTILQSGIAQAAAGGGGYQIARSLRFNSADSAYLSRTPASASNRKTWTWSANIKRSALDTEQFLFDCSLALNETSISFSTGNTLVIYAAVAGSVVVNLITTQVFRDVGAHMNIQLTADTTQATAANRLKLYINGVQVTAFSTATYCAQNTDLIINTANAHSIGRNTNGANRYASMYFSDMRLIDGQALDPTSFGEFDTNTGVWMPKTYSGTYGTNGFWLKFDDNSNNTAATLGKDSSGNSNNWTPNNFSVTAGVGNDSLVDSPTNYGTDTGVGGEVRGNYATWNPLSKTSGTLTLTNGNLQLGDGTASSRCNSTMQVSSGKWYFEVTLATAGTNTTVGIGQGDITSQYPGQDALSYAQTLEAATKINNNTQPSYGVSLTTGDVFQVAFDLDNNKLFFGKNGTWMASSDPVSGANPVYTLTAGTYQPIARPFGTGAIIHANFGQRPFAYTAPSGFKALTTTNLPTPAIGATSTTLASKNMNVVTYTGDGTNNRNITGVGFQPDLVWVKSRSNTYDHQLVDSVRGGGKELYSNLTNAESTLNTIPAFISDGFQVNGGTYAGTNGNGATFVGWTFKGGGTAVTNTAGSISSQVSANPTAGISIVTWTGNGVSTATVGHGLGMVPAMIICKERTGTDYWHVKHKSLDSLNNLFLNVTNAQLSAATVGDGVLGDLNSSTTFGFATAGSPGNVVAVNENGITNVAYCFAEVAGFSKFGSYVGNGSADGPFVYCGFRPRYIFIKNTASGSWEQYDTARDTYNQASLILEPNSSGAEATAAGYVLDFLSNGFKLRGTGSGINTSGNTFIFAAFAEAPFNYARAR